MASDDRRRICGEWSVQGGVATSFETDLASAL